VKTTKKKKARQESEDGAKRTKGRRKSADKGHENGAFQVTKTQAQLCGTMKCADIIILRDVTVYSLTA
jgi:hypothetical protein